MRIDARITAGARFEADASAADQQQDLAVGDVTGDGTLDVVAASWNSRIYLFRGTGGGALAPQVNVSAGGTPVAVKLADLDGDGDLDVVYGGENNQILVQLNNGTGTFTAALPPLVSTENYYAVEVTDLDADGDLDIVTSDANDSITVLFRQPSLTWMPADLPLGGMPTGLASGDWNGDGHRDLAVAMQGGAVTILLGNATGTGFQQSMVPVPGAPVDVVASDLDRDGDADLVVTHTNGTKVTVLRGAGDGSFTVDVETTLATGGRSIHDLARTAVGDLDGDGFPDVVIPSAAGGMMEVLFTNDPMACPP